MLHASQIQFRTAWFVESVVSATFIVLVIRSRKPFFRSQPGKYLLISTMTIIGVTLLLPLTPMATLFGFSPLPVHYFLLIGLINLCYVLTAELAKKIFYRMVKF